MQKKFFYAAALVLSTLCSFLSADNSVSCHHHRDKTYNDVWPTARLLFAPRQICENGAIAGFSEIALRNLRFNATYGHRFCLCDGNVFKVKVSGEYLMQKLDYHFRTGKARRWVRQMAIGGEGRYDLCNCYVNNALLGAWYSFSPSKRLDTRECSNNLYVRRIAGAHAYGFKGGANVTPWGCANVDLNVFYDHVHYQRKFHDEGKRSHAKVAAGWGLGVNYYQPLFCDLSLRLCGEWRQPYDFYSAQLNWQKCLCNGLLTVGLFANYTQGKERLPNVANGGIQLGFDFGRGSSYNDCCYDTGCAPACCEYSEIEQYVLQPAVYVPEVLAIAEDRGCIGPSVVGTIANVTIPAFQDVEINVNDYFKDGNGGTLHFSIATTPSFLNGPYVNLDASGVLHLNNLGGLPSTVPSLVVVTAFTSCGSVQTSFVATFLPAVP